jgi:hypothetical protein
VTETEQNHWITYEEVIDAVPDPALKIDLLVLARRSRSLIRP